MIPSIEAGQDALSAARADIARVTGPGIDLVSSDPRQARGRGIQQPLLLLHVEYSDPFFRIGFLEEGLKLVPGRAERDRWLGGSSPTDVADVTLNVEGVAERLNQHKAKIARVRLWLAPQLKVAGTLPEEAGSWREDL